jgi:hypothetical protein
VAGGVDAAREWRLAGQAEVVDLVPARPCVARGAELVARPVGIWIVGRVGQVGGGVEAIDLDARLGDEPRTPLRCALEGGVEALARPSVLVLAPARIVTHAGKCAGWTDDAATVLDGVPGTRSAFGADMFTLIRRLVIGWLLTKLLRRLTGNSAAPRRR